MHKFVFPLAMLMCGAVHAAGPSADFSVETGPFRRALHSSGYAPKSVSTHKTAEEIKALNFDFVRTHDLALINPGQRVVDTQYIFPLPHLDAKDPKNYYFKATDHLLKMSRDAGLKIFYRLGTSIEHSGPDVHFNTLIPEDFDKQAEVFAGTVRHYTRGWADGFDWDIKYWEIWNEPDGFNNMWCLPDGDGGKGATEAERKADRAKRDAKRRALFIEFFVKCLKRLKSEFPELKIGGPALCWMNPSYFRDLLKACKEAGVAPDFISWHYYGMKPADIIDAAAQARKLCDSFGFKDCELIINEWHYLGSYSWGGLRNADPAVQKRVWEGPASHNGIDSSCFTLSTLAQLQTSEYDQAYFYGCRHSGAWGYKNELNKKYKIWYALELFGSLAKECTMLCASAGKGTVTTLATRSSDGKTGWLLVSDYRGTNETLTVEVKGVRNLLSATLLDHARDNEPVDVAFTDGRLTLKKKMPGSAAFLVKFNLGDNPILSGWYADPQIRKFGDRYWIFPTYSQDFAKQTVMDAFSSKDLKTWTKHEKVLKAEDISWAYDCLWAPDIHEKDGKYYLFFGANEARPVENAITRSVPALQKMKKLTVQPVGHRKYGGIGVAVADRPEGPYRDLIGKPLIDQFWNKAQPIDQFAFRYKDEWYMIYGGWRRCNLVKLAPDFKSLLPLDDGKMWRDITPQDYVEGSVMFERKGKWYFMYSSGSWTRDTYRVNYSVGDSPFGPFTFKGTVLSSQRPLATGAGHHSVLNVPGTDDWYICYHRRPIPSLSMHHRVTCLDRMYFDENGDIKPIEMTR